LGDLKPCIIEQFESFLSLNNKWTSIQDEMGFSKLKAVEAEPLVNIVEKDNQGAVEFHGVSPRTKLRGECPILCIRAGREIKTEYKISKTRLRSENRCCIAKPIHSSIPN